MRDLTLLPSYTFNPGGTVSFVGASGWQRYVNLLRGKQFSGYLHRGSMEEELWPHAQAKLLSFYLSCELT